MNYLVTGPPGHGKTAFMTGIALKGLENKANKHVFTTWPVFHPILKKWTTQWRREYIFDGIQDSIILIDEAHMLYPARRTGGGNGYNKDITKPGVTHDEHIAWSTCRHDGNDFYFCSQSMDRLDTIIREVWEIWWKCKAQEIPIVRLFSDQLLNMRVLGFDEATAKEPYRMENHFLPGILSYRTVFASYNTHAQRKSYEPKDYPMWEPSSDVKAYLRSLGAQPQDEAENKPAPGANS